MQQLSLKLAKWTALKSLCSIVKIPNSVDLSCILEEYHEFADIFSKAKANTLAPHQPYDLKINLEEGSNPLFGLIYSMSPSKLQSL